MTQFVVLALLLSLLAAAFIGLPLLRAKGSSGRAPLSAALTLLVLLLAGVGLYIWLGADYWSAAPAQASDDQTISTLARHLELHPDDQSGWLVLGQAYGGLGNYSLALRCYQRANRLSVGGNAAALAGMGEALLMQEDSGQSEKAGEYLERALQLDPQSAKALFYSAVLAFRDGRLALAKQRFQAMLTMSPPESIRVALQHQIDDIDAQLASAASTPSRGEVDAATAIHLHVSLSPALADKVPPGASLFVFVRAPSGGPPLAVKRSDMRLPQDVDLSAADAMVAARAVQPGQSVSVVARISATGSPLPQSGDLYGEIRTVAGKGGAQALQIDRLNP
jgi:cytochrome c-type biogenesis protein CcmH